MSQTGYQVIARKWRPQIFDDVVGQDHVVRTLKNAIIRNRIAHAYLFVGNVAGCVAVDELDLVGNSEFLRTEFRLPGKEPTQINAEPGDFVVPRPGAQHFA